MNKLYTFSRYATQHIKDNKAYGITISGYIKREDGSREYVNVWIDTDDGKSAAITKAHDGTFRLTVKLVGVTDRVKEDKKGDAPAAKKKIEEDFTDIDILERDKCQR